MKKNLFFTLLATLCLTNTISFAQSGENSNPYAIFGCNPYIAGEQSGSERIKVFVIENIAEGSRVSRLEHDTHTGVVTFFDRDGMVLGHKQLKPGERAWPTMDPKAEKYYSISPYAFTLNNPVRYIDPNGMEVWGVTRADAANVMNDFRQMFQGDEFEKFRNLIVQSGKNQNGRSLAHIGSDALSAAFDGITLTEDQQALVDMTVNTINSSDKHFVEYISSDGMVSSRGQSAFSGELGKMGLPMETIISANGGIPASIISAFGGAGLTTQTGQGTHSVMVGNNHPYGRAITTGHEVIGHGRSLAVGRGHANQHVDAVQTENLLFRVMGINYVNNGINHGPKEIIPNPSALPGFR
ncbi:MAG: hypothetical protein LBR65_03525 [Culturomica sp.]|jgi:hypothetical protein|nr:hypothetical protein [Culturomica sp.]